LLVGFLSGVYSTIFIASPVILLWENRIVRK
jgi:preprotein translocase subunit SecF